MSTDGHSVDDVRILKQKILSQDRSFDVVVYKMNLAERKYKETIHTLLSVQNVNGALRKSLASTRKECADICKTKEDTINAMKEDFIVKTEEFESTIARKCAECKELEFEILCYQKDASKTKLFRDYKRANTNMEHEVVALKADISTYRENMDEIIKEKNRDIERLKTKFLELNGVVSKFSKLRNSVKVMERVNRDLRAIVESKNKLILSMQKYAPDAYTSRTVSRETYLNMKTTNEKTMDVMRGLVEQKETAERKRNVAETSMKILKERLEAQLVLHEACRVDNAKRSRRVVTLEGECASYAQKIKEMEICMEDLRDELRVARERGVSKKRKRENSTVSLQQRKRRKKTCVCDKCAEETVRVFRMTASPGEFSCIHSLCKTCIDQSPGRGFWKHCVVCRKQFVSTLEYVEGRVK